MANQFADVEKFMRAMDQDVPALPSYPDIKTIDMRMKIVGEEYRELIIALNRAHMNVECGAYSHKNRLNNLIEIADAVADTVYVNVGTALAFGLPIERIFDIVTAANMAKKDGPVREDGKRLKPPGWQPPEPMIEKTITDMWANAAPVPVVQRDGVDFEGPLDAAPS